jgi:23S rRNA (adenine2503-C2)-methyltransferase
MSLQESPLIYDLSFSGIEEIVLNLGEPSFRAKQIWQGIYKNLWQTPDDFSNLSKSFRQKLSQTLRFTSLTPERKLESSDGATTKYLMRLPDGNSIETVLMMYKERRTICISTQVGCALGCVFCATGQMGFIRNLSTGEIVEQVLFFAQKLKDKGDHLTNVVVMGMGEPFNNYDATLSAITRLNDSQGFNMGERRFTISTVGLTPAINRFAEEKRQINLAISLHAANDLSRDSLLPINRKYPLRELIKAVKYYTNMTSRRVSFEYALIHDKNDSTEDALELAYLLKGLLCHVNIILLNPTDNFTGKAASKQNADAFRKCLVAKGISCTIRLRRGMDIKAGCGQLATSIQNKK